MAMLIRRITGTLCLVLAVACACYAFAVRNTHSGTSFWIVISVRSFVRNTRIRSALPVVDDIAKTGQRHLDCGRVYWSGRVRHGGRLHRQ